MLFIWTSIYILKVFSVLSLREKCYSELFLSAFYRIRTKCGEICDTLHAVFRTRTFSRTFLGQNIEKMDKLDFRKKASFFFREFQPTSVLFLIWNSSINCSTSFLSQKKVYFFCNRKHTL